MILIIQDKHHKFGNQIIRALNIWNILYLFFYPFKDLGFSSLLVSFTLCCQNKRNFFKSCEVFCQFDQAYFKFARFLYSRRLDGSVTAQKEIVQRAQRQLVRFQVSQQPLFYFYCSVFILDYWSRFNVLLINGFVILKNWIFSYPLIAILFTTSRFIIIKTVDKYIMINIW